MGAELSSESFAEAAELIVRGKRAEAIKSVAVVLAAAGAAAFVGVIAGPVAGAAVAPVAAASATGLIGRLAEAMVDRTEAMLEAGRKHDSEMAQRHELQVFLREAAEASLRDLRGALTELADVQREQFLQSRELQDEYFGRTLLFVHRNVATREGQEEGLGLLREILQRARAGPATRANRRKAADILRPGTATRPAGLKNPATLLTARYEVVPFIEAVRRKELRDIEAWCAAPEPVSVRLFLGPGGAGKTRLFIEAAKRLRQEQWDAGFLPESASEDNERDALEGTRSTLLIVDYAEARRELPRLLAAIAELRPPAPRRVRLALVAREIADWWRLMLGLAAPIADLLRAHEPRTLRPGDIPLAERKEAFEQSAQAFAIELSKPVPRALPDLSNPTFGRMLYVAMAALASVDGSNLPPERLLGETLDHERRYLKLHYFDDRSLDLREQSDFMDRALRLLAAATLRGGLSTREETESVSRRVLGPEEARTPHGLRVLHGLYAATPAGNLPAVSSASSYLAAIEPDLLGEELVAQVLGHSETPGGYLPLVFEDAPEPAVLQGFVVLGRLGARGTDVRQRRWIASVLHADVSSRARPALDAALTLTQETAHTPLGQVLHEALELEGSVAAAQEIMPRVPWPTVALREVGAWATERVLASTSPDALVERAGLLNNLGNRLSDVGRREDALAATEEALRHRRTLAAARPDAFISSLAMSLNNLGAMLSALGRREDALAATEEAVQLSLPLARSRPAVFVGKLETRCTNLEHRLAAAGRTPESSPVLAEARALLRKLGASGIAPGAI